MVLEIKKLRTNVLTRYLLFVKHNKLIENTNFSKILRNLCVIYDMKINSVMQTVFLIK